MLPILTLSMTFVGLSLDVRDPEEYTLVPHYEFMEFIPVENKEEEQPKIMFMEEVSCYRSDPTHDKDTSYISQGAISMGYSTFHSCYNTCYTSWLESVLVPSQYGMLPGIDLYG